MDSELIAFLSARFDEVRADFGTVVEGLRHDVRAISEGHAVIRYEIADLRRESSLAHELESRLRRLEAS